MLDKTGLFWEEVTNMTDDKLNRLSNLSDVDKVIHHLHIALCKDQGCKFDILYKEGFEQYWHQVTLERKARKLLDVVNMDVTKALKACRALV